MSIDKLMSFTFAVLIISFSSNLACDWGWDSFKEKSKELASDAMDGITNGYEKSKQTISESYDSVHDSDEELSIKFSSQYRSKNISGFLKNIARAPSQVINMPDGTSVYIWSNDTSHNSAPVCTTINNVTRCTSGQHIPGSCDKSVFTDKSGIITEIKVSGCSEYYYFSEPEF